MLALGTAGVPALRSHFKVWFGRATADGWIRAAAGTTTGLDGGLEGAASPRPMGFLANRNVPKARVCLDLRLGHTGNMTKHVHDGWSNELH